MAVADDNNVSPAAGVRTPTSAEDFGTYVVANRSDLLTNADWRRDQRVVEAIVQNEIAAQGANTPTANLKRSTAGFAEHRNDGHPVLVFDTELHICLLR